MTIERHPFPPFLPATARILMSGSFPPPPSRWCMDFYYPNRQNDMWRILALIYFGDPLALMLPDGKTFDQPKIENFCREIGLALTDTGEEVIRAKGNASDAHLNVVKPRNFNKLLDKLPLCHDIVLTGEKAVETLGQIAGFGKIAVGEYVETDYFNGRNIKVWRMPSTSRAYPRPLAWKAEYYGRVFKP